MIYDVKKKKSHVLSQQKRKTSFIKGPFSSLSRKLDYKPIGKEVYYLEQFGEKEICKVNRVEM